jgi:hypothetical protein
LDFSWQILNGDTVARATDSYASNSIGRDPVITQISDRNLLWLLFHSATRRSISFQYGHFGSCLHFNCNVLIWVSSRNQSEMKIQRSILVWDKRASGQQFLAVFGAFSISMEQRVLNTSLREESHGRRKFVRSWLNMVGKGTFPSYPDVSDWVRQFCMGRECAEDSRLSGRPSGFQTHFRIQGALEASPNASVRDIAQTLGIAPTTGFYVLTQVLLLEFSNWRCTPDKLSDDQKRTRV